MTEAKYEDLVSVLTDAGVQLRDLNGEYRSTYDIISDLAAKWDDLSSMTQAALATNIAGTRQQNVFYSLVEQFQEASGAMDTMANSEGELTQAHETYLNSIEGRISVLNASFQELSTMFVDSKLLGGVISFATSIVNAIGDVASFIDYIGGMKTALLAIATALSVVVGGLIAYKAELIATTVVTKLSTILTGLHTAVMNLVYAIPNAIVAWKAYAAGVVSASTAIQASIPILGIILVAITAVTVAINAHNSALEEQAQKSMETSEAAAKMSDELSDLVNKYIELSEAVKTDKSVKDQLLSTQTELIDKLGLEKSRIQELVGEYGNYADAIKAATSEKLKEKEIEIQGGLNAYENAVIDAAQTRFDFPGMSAYLNDFVLYLNAASDKYEENFEAYQKLLSNGMIGVHLENHAGITNGGLDKIDTVELTNDYDLKTLEGIRDAYEEIGKVLEYLRQNGYGSTDVYQSYFTLYDSLSEPLKNYDNAIEELNENLAQQYMLNGLIGKETPKTADEFQAFRDKLVESAKASGEFVGSDKEIADSIDNVLSKQPQFAQFYDNGIDGLSGLSDEGENAATSLSDLKDALDTISDEIDTIQSAYNTVKDLIDDYSENGYLSLDNLQSLLELEPEYLNLLMDENGQLNLNSQSYEKLAKAKLEDLLLTQIKTTFTNILNMGVEEAAAYAAAEAYDSETGSLYKLIEAETQHALLQASIKDRDNKTTAYTDAVSRYITTIPTLVSLVDDYSFAAEHATSESDALKDSLNEQKDALEAEKDALEDSKNALEDYKDELTDAQNQIQDLIDLVMDYLRKQKEAERDVLEERKEAFDDLIEKEKEELATKKEAAEFEEKLKSKQNAYAKDALAVSIASLDDSAAGKKAKKEADDALIKSRNDLYSTLAEHEYDIRVDALDALKQTQDDYYDAEIAKIDEYLDNERQIYEDACREIENDTGDLYDRLWDYTYRHTTQTRAEFDYLWTSAQEAIERYGGAQVGVINIMEYLQLEIYDTERQIGDLDDAIGVLDGRIDSVSTAIDNLGNGSINNLTNRIRDLKRELSDLEELNSDKWVYEDYNGRNYYSKLDDRGDAIRDIMGQMGVDPINYTRAGSAISASGHFHRYATGTYGAYGGPSIVNEQGHEIRVLNKGDGILTAKITRNLSNLGSDPVSFLADAGKKLLSKISSFGLFGKPVTNPTTTYAVSNGGDMPITITNHINGDVNPSTLKALEKAQKDITQNAINGMMKMTLGLRNSSRVR